MNNPFEAPEDRGGERFVPVDAVLADPGTRLGAVLVDNIALFASMIPGFALAMLLISSLGITDDEESTLLVMFLALPCGLGLTGYQWYLTSTEGTTVGKRLLGIRIVRDDGSPVDFFTGVILRGWVIGLLSALVGCVIPLAGNLLGLVDALMVYSEHHKTLHDRIAGTRVIVAGSGSGDGELFRID